MKKVTGVLLVVLGVGAGLSAQTTRMLQRASQVAIHSLPTDQRPAPSIWADLPGMRGAITLPKGGLLVATLSMEVRTLHYGPGRPDLLVRMVVDNQVVPGSDIRFAAGRNLFRPITRDFIGGALKPGVHKVRFQWMKRPSNAIVYARQRRLVLRFAAPDSEDFKMVALQNVSVGSTGPKSWTNFPTLKTTITLPWTGDLVICYSGDAFSKVAGKAILVRALVDGAKAGDAVMIYGDVGGSQSFVFAKRGLAKGTHTVQMQYWMDAGGTIYRPWTIVEAYPSGGGRKAAVASYTYEGPGTSRSSSTYAPVPSVGLGLIRTRTKGDLEVRFSAETRIPKGSRGYLRCVVDGKYVGNPIEFGEEYDDPYRIWVARSAVWVARDLDPGYHAVRIDWAAATGTFVLAGRSLVLTSVQGQRPLLVTALESTRPTGYKYGGKFASSVVTLQNGRRVFRSYVGDNLWRSSPGVADWFVENSDSNLFLVEAGLVGPHLKKYDEKTYRSFQGAFTMMKIEALQKADPYFDYSYYDRNGDRKITTDELYPLVILYQDWPWGEVRNNITNVATSDGVTLDFRGGLATVYTPDFRNRSELGIHAHELSHLLIRAGDMYENRDPTAPGPYSIMDQHPYNGHLDPLHKWKAGKFLEPEIVGKDGYVTLNPIAVDPRVLLLRDPRSHTGEFFLVENRGGKGYNASLPAKGLALWHCDQNRLWNWRTAIEIEPAGGSGGWYKYGTYLFTGNDPGFAASKDVWDGSTLVNTRWHDRTRSGIGLFGIERIQGTDSIRVYVDVPGPGILVQWRNRRVDIGAGHKFTAQLRVVNTDYTAASATVTLASPAGLSWTRKTLSLSPYVPVLLNVDVTPTSFSQDVLASVVGSRGGGSQDRMRLAGSCRSIASVTPRSLPNLTLGAFDVNLNLPAFVEAVSLGGRLIKSRDANDWSKGYFEVLNGNRTVRVHPPQGLAPGVYPLAVRFPLCTSGSVNVTLSRVTSFAIATTLSLTTGRTQTVWVSKGGLPVGSVGVLTLSGSPKPSVIPNLVSLGLGDGFRSLIILPAQVVNGTTNVAPWAFPTPGSLLGKRLYFQGVLINPYNLSRFFATPRTNTDYK